MEIFRFAETLLKLFRYSITFKEIQLKKKNRTETASSAIFNKKASY